MPSELPKFSGVNLSWESNIAPLLQEYGWELRNTESAKVTKGNKVGFDSVDPSITRACDHQCQHCWAQLGGEPMSIDVFKKTLKFAKEAGVETIQFTGGEPTLWPHLAEMAKLAHDMGFRNIIRTHGRNLDQKAKGSDLTRAEVLSKYFDRVVVSLDGLAEENFQMRPAKKLLAESEKANALAVYAKQQFEETIAGYKLLCTTALEEERTSGKRPEIHMNTVVAQKNHDKLGGLAQFLSEGAERGDYFIDRWDLTQVAAGLTDNKSQSISPDKYMISGEEFANALVLVSQHSRNISKRAKPMTESRSLIINIEGGVLVGGEGGKGKLIGRLSDNNTEWLVDKIQNYVTEKDLYAQKDDSYLHYNSP